MWVCAVVELDVAEGVELEPQAASTNAAKATVVTTAASLVSFRFLVMVISDLLCGFA